MAAIVKNKSAITVKGSADIVCDYLSKFPHQAFWCFICL